MWSTSFLIVLNWLLFLVKESLSSSSIPYGDTSYGDTSYGTWVSDQFGNPAFRWTGGIPTNGTNNASSPTIYITSPTIVHAVGNDRWKALVLSDGTVTLRQDEGGAKLLQGISANASAYQFLGGIGYVANATNVLASSVINGTLGIGVTPSPNPINLVLGVGNVVKTIGTPINVGNTEEDKAYVQLTHSIIAPFGDDTVVFSFVDIARWAGPYSSFADTELSWTEVWGSGNRYEMGWGADGYPVSGKGQTLSFESVSSSAWQQSWLHSFETVHDDATGNVIGLVDKATIRSNLSSKYASSPPPPPGLPQPSPHDPSPRPAFLVCLSCITDGDWGLAQAQLQSYTTYGSTIFDCNTSVPSAAVNCPVTTNAKVLLNGLNNDTSNTDATSNLALRVTFRVNLNTTTAPSGSVVYSSVPGAVRLGFLIGYLTEEDENTVNGNLTAAVLAKIQPYLSDPYRTWNTEDEYTADAWAGYSNSLLFASSDGREGIPSVDTMVANSVNKDEGLSTFATPGPVEKTRSTDDWFATHSNERERLGMMETATDTKKFAVSARWSPMSSIEAIKLRVRAAYDPWAYANECKQQRTDRGVSQSWTSWEGREAMWHAYMLRSGVGLTYDSFYGGHTMNQNGNYLFVSGQNAAARDPLGYAAGLTWGGPSATPYIIEVLNLTMRGKRVATDAVGRPGGSIQWGNAAYGMDSSGVFNQSDTELYFLLTLSQYVLSTRDTATILQAMVPWNGTVTTLGEAAWASYLHFETVISTGEHGIVRLLLSDHNDGLLSSLQVPESPEIMQYAESVMNAGLAAYVLPQYADTLLLLNETVDANERAMRVNATANAQREAAGNLAWSEVTNSSGTFGWYRRAYLGNASSNVTGWRGDVNGDGTMWTETQSWHILGKTPLVYGGQEKVDALVELIDKLARDPSPIGALNTPPFRMVDGGVGYGGTWFCGEVALISALASAGYLDKALSEYRKASLNQHAIVYPNIWFGITSGADVWNSIYATVNSTGGAGPGSTRCHWNDDGQTFPCEELAFPIFNSWSHTVGVYTVPSLFGAVFDRYGLTISPQLDEDYYSIWAPLVSVVKLPTVTTNGSCNYLGHWAPYVAEGEMVNVRIMLNEVDRAVCTSLRVNGKNEPLVVDPVTHAIVISAIVENVGIKSGFGIITWELGEHGSSMQRVNENP